MFSSTLDCAEDFSTLPSAWADFLPNGASGMPDLDAIYSGPGTYCRVGGRGESQKVPIANWPRPDKPTPA